MRIRLVVALFTTSLLGACTHAPYRLDSQGAAAGHALSPQESELFSKQAPLLLVVGAIAKLDTHGRHIGGMSIAVEEGYVDVYWKGAAPRAVEEVARRHGVSIRIHPSVYSKSELLAAERKIAASHDRYPTVVFVAPANDGSKLLLGVTRVENSTSWRFPVAVEEFVATPIEETSRAADTAPFSSGAVIVNHAGNRACTSGFGMYRRFGGIFWVNGHGIATAYHCGPSAAFTTGAGVPIGTAEVRPGGDFRVDAQYIPTDSVSGAMINGGVGVGEFSQIVSNNVAVVPGTIVCSSGAVSGELCNEVVASVEGMGFNGGVSTQGVVIVYGYKSGLAVVVKPGLTRPGDSGGPVFVPDGSRVWAAGMEIGAVPWCIPQRYPFVPRCETVGMAFVDIDSVVGFLGGYTQTH